MYLFPKAWLTIIYYLNQLWFSLQNHGLALTVFALRFENLLARNWSMKIFKHEKEEKLAGPTGNFAGPAPFLVASGLEPALNAKTALMSKHDIIAIWLYQPLGWFVKGNIKCICIFII